MASWVAKAIERIAAQSKRAAIALTALATLSISVPVAAQSPHGCVGLENLRVRMSEGLDGMFFRIEPDLMMETRLSDGMIQEIARLSDALRSRGTTLVYLPVPTKGLVHADKIGPDAIRYGYDARLARALFSDTVVKLRSSEVVTVDSVAALVSLAAGETAFFGTDPRMTNAGLRQLARSVASELGQTHQGAHAFRTSAEDDHVLPSRDRFALQMACQAALPELVSTRYVTREVAIEGNSSKASVALVGSTITNGSDRNLRGFLSEALGHRIDHDVISDSSHTALTAFLTSDSYRSDPPDLLIWLVPIWENPARFGDQPMRELTAAAADRCSGTTQMAPFRDGRFRVAADGLSITANTSLRLETGGSPVTRAVFRFTSPEGEVRARSITRQETELATDRMYMPLTGLWPEGVAEISVETDAPEQTAPTIAVCRDS